MNHYETVFILTPVLSDEQIKEAVAKFKAILTAEGAEIVNEENWGLKKLAYPIAKKSTGYYKFIEFDAEPTIVEKLEVQFRRDERVIRFLTMRQDKFAAAYAAKRRSIKASQPVVEKAEEATAAPAEAEVVEAVVVEPIVETVVEAIEEIVTETVEAAAEVVAPAAEETAAPTEEPKKEEE